MKLKSLLLATACVCSITGSAQIAWNPSAWGSENADNNELSVSQDNTIIDRLKTGKTRGDLRNAIPLTYSTTEGYVIMKLRVHDLTLNPKDFKMQIYYYEKDSEGNSVISYNGSKQLLSYIHEDGSDVYYAYMNYQADGRSDEKLKNDDGTDGDYISAKNVFTGDKYTLYGGSSENTLDDGSKITSWMSFVLGCTRSTEENADPYYEILNICSAQAVDVETGTKNDNIKAIADGTFVPAVVNETTGVHYANITSAFNVANALGDDFKSTQTILRVNKDQTIDTRLGCNGYSIKIVGAVDEAGKPAVKITRTKTGNIMFLLNSGSKSTLNLQDIILDGNGGTSDKNFVEVNSGSKLTVDNVVFQNCTITHNGGFINAKAGSTVAINGLTAETGCAFSGEGKATVLANNDNTTLSGVNKLSVWLASTKAISASDLTNESPINIYTTNHTDGSIVVKGWTDSSKFKLMNSDYTLMGKDGNLVLGAESSTNGNVKIGNSVFADLASAVKAAKTGDVIDVTDDLSVEGTLNAEGRNLTIRGNRPTENNSKVIRREESSNATATIIRTGADMLILANQGETVTLQDLNIDGKNVESTNNLIEASGNSTVVLNNVEIADAKSSNALGLVVAKGGGSLSLTDVEINNSTVNESTGTVFVGNTSTATLSGADVVSVSLESNSTLVDAGLTNTKENPISLYAYAGNGTTFGSATIAAGEGVTVNAEKFSTTEDYALTANTSNNTLTFAAKVVNGVEGVNADDVNAPVEYFNLQGQRVANPANGIFIRRQGNTVTKVSLR
jgi:hypothetical protein